MTAKFFHDTGGDLHPDHPTYIVRQADRDLLEALLAGEFCFALTARQFGKSSLIHRTAQELRRRGATVVRLNLDGIGTITTAESWYESLMTRMGAQSGCTAAVQDLWRFHARLSPLQRWMRSLRDGVLGATDGPVIVFIDEIDYVRGLPFATDELFAAIRECYNSRAADPACRRLTFGLFGVATPADLIRDPRATPFNIGRRIVMSDFTLAEAEPLVPGLRRVGEVDDGPARQRLARILHWTGGHPYLTQYLGGKVAEDQDAGADAAADVDRICTVVFLSPQARSRDEHLRFVGDQLLGRTPDLPGVLELLPRIRRRKVVLNEADPRHTALRLSGMVREEEGRMVFRNPVYAAVFDRAWCKAKLPDDERRRQRRAFGKGAVFSAVGFAVVAGLGYLAWERDRAARRVQELQEAERELRIGEIRRRIDFRLRKPLRPDRLTPYPQKEVARRVLNNLGEFEILEDSYLVDLREWRPLSADAPPMSSSYVLDRQTKMLNVQNVEELHLEARTTGRELIRHIYSPYSSSVTILKADEKAPVGKQAMLSRTAVVNIKDLPKDEEFLCHTRTTYWDALQRPEDWWFGVIGYRGSYRVSLLLLFPVDRPYVSFELKRAGADRTEGLYDGKRIVYEDPDHRWIYWEIPKPEDGSVYKIQWTWPR